MTKTVDMTTSKGVIRIELDDEKAPESVRNFLDYAAKGTTTTRCSTASSRAS